MMRAQPSSKPSSPTIQTHDHRKPYNPWLESAIEDDDTIGSGDRWRRVCHGAQVCRRSFLVPTLLNACGVSLKKFLELNARRGTKALFADDSCET